jgi:hypothetical protein
MSMATVNLIFDFILIAASFWMVTVVRGLGGVVGRGLNLITIGTVFLGMAHLIATAMRYLMSTGALTIDAPTEGLFHRIIVLVGFLLLVVGFRRINTIRR